MKVVKFSWITTLAWLLVVFFLVGAIGNIFASEQIAADYARWGYPGWFHYFTGAVELIVAILLAVASVRFWGAALGSLVMCAALLTVLLHGEFGHAIAPLIVMVLSIAIAWNGKPKRATD